MRIGFPSYQAVRSAHHLRGNMGVEVECGDDGHGIADHRSHRSQQIPFQIDAALHRCRPVQRHEDSIYRERLVEPR